MQNVPNSLIVWDLETSGLDAKTGSKILEIGAMVISDDKVISTHQWVLNHGIEIPEEIVKITGITNEIIAAEGRDPGECVDEFLALLNGAETHLTHNGFRFDIPFLIEQAKQLKAGSLSDEEYQSMQSKLEERGIDTAVMFKADRMNMSRKDGETFKQFADRIMSIRQYGLKYNVGACCDFYGIDRTNIVQHRAIGDITLTLEIYRKITGPMANA